MKVIKIQPDGDPDVIKAFGERMAERLGKDVPNLERPTLDVNTTDDVIRFKLAAAQAADEAAGATGKSLDLKFLEGTGAAGTMGVIWAYTAHPRTSLDAYLEIDTSDETIVSEIASRVGGEFPKLPKPELNPYGPHKHGDNDHFGLRQELPRDNEVVLGVLDLIKDIVEVDKDAFIKIQLSPEDEHDGFGPDFPELRRWVVRVKELREDS